NNFSPGQKVAMVAVNLNPDFLDAAQNGAGVFPAIPNAAYSFTADMVLKGGASYDENADLVPFLSDFGNPVNYQGMESSEETASNPYAIAQREANARGELTFQIDAPSKSVSTIQKGEVRSFLLVEPTFPPPPIQPGPDDPDR